jgi:hypothetical protein
VAARWFGRPRVGNCLLFVLGLWLRGRVRRVFRRKGHWMAETHRGNFVHLKCLRDEDRRRACPPWYLGRPHLISGSGRWRAG